MSHSEMDSLPSQPPSAQKNVVNGTQTTERILPPNIKMLRAVHHVVRRTGAQIDFTVLENYEACRAFLAQHQEALQQREEIKPASEAQKIYALKLMAQTGIDLPENWQDDSWIAGKYIEQAKKQKARLRNQNIPAGIMLEEARRAAFWLKITYEDILEAVESGARWSHAFKGWYAPKDQGMIDPTQKHPVNREALQKWHDPRKDKQIAKKCEELFQGM